MCSNTLNMVTIARMLNGINTYSARSDAQASVSLSLTLLRQGYHLTLQRQAYNKRNILK